MCALLHQEGSQGRINCFCVRLLEVTVPTSVGGNGGRAILAVAGGLMPRMCTGTVILPCCYIGYGYLVYPLCKYDLNIPAGTLLS